MVKRDKKLVLYDKIMICQNSQRLFVPTAINKFQKHIIDKSIVTLSVLECQSEIELIERVNLVTKHSSLEKVNLELIKGLDSFVVKRVLSRAYYLIVFFVKRNFGLIRELVNIALIYVLRSLVYRLRLIEKLGLSELILDSVKEKRSGLKLNYKPISEQNAFIVGLL